MVFNVFLPPEISEEYFLETLETVVKSLAHNFVFGMYDLADISQEARIMGMEAMVRYDVTRPLSPFLYAHLKNRLINHKRNKWRRCDSPCNLCATGRSCEHPDGLVCASYIKWKKRNDAKANIMRPLDIAFIVDESEVNMKTESVVENTAETKELLKKIDEQLPAELRSAYLKILADEPVSKTKRDAVECAIRTILGCPEGGTPHGC